VQHNQGQYPDLSSWRSGAPFEPALHPKREKPGFKVHHFLALVSNKLGGICQIEMCSAGSKIAPIESPIEDGQIVHFTDGIFHRCLRAHHSGWRIAMIMTVYGGNPLKTK
jgi:hypothetical protein